MMTAMAMAVLGRARPMALFPPVMPAMVNDIGRRTVRTAWLAIHNRRTIYNRRAIYTVWRAVHGLRRWNINLRRSCMNDTRSGDRIADRCARDGAPDERAGTIVCLRGGSDAGGEDRGGGG